MVIETDVALYIKPILGDDILSRLVKMQLY